MQQFNPSPIRSSRRGFVTGSATVGAAAVAAVALPGVGHQQAAVELPPPAKPERGGGYRVSEHVKRYYKTTLV